MGELEARAEHLQSRQDLVGFFDRLADSVVEEPELWENDTLEQFLRAWSVWLSEMDGYFIGRQEAVPEVPSWRLVAQMLLAAKVYE